MLELDSDDTFVKPFHCSSSHKLIQRPTCSRLPKDNGYGCVLYCLLEC